MERLQRLWRRWFEQFNARPDEASLWPLGWLLEEYRISLFAPDIPVIGKISEKKIEEMLREIL
jgi:ATP-dependent helicase HrpA